MGNKIFIVCNRDWMLYNGGMFIPPKAIFDSREKAEEYCLLNNIFVDGKTNNGWTIVEWEVR